MLTVSPSNPGRGAMSQKQAGFYDNEVASNLLREQV